MDKELFLYNTMSRKVDKFTSLNPGEARMYTCGPTVYNFAHIGNFRAYIFEDLLHRALKYFGYNVRQVMNLTDVDDKTIRDSQAAKLPLKEFTAKYIKAFFEIKSIARRLKPDIIHLHSSKAGALGRIAFNGRNTPVFYTPHGYSFLMQNHSAMKRFIYKTVESVCSRRNCTTISCSEGEHKETLKLTKNATYVNNGINVEELQRLIDQAGPINDHPLTVFTLGRVCYQKNPDLFNKIAENLPEVKFLWIGDGELRNKLTAPNIEITGWVKREDALRYSLHGDIFLLTSLWEGLPISLLEAMYMKKLCVVNNVIGNRDVIHNGKNGFVCDNIDDFVTAIASAGDQRKYIDNAYQDVLNKYNTKVMAASYSKIYLDKYAGGGGTV